MKTILLEVDEETSREYQGLSPENKQQFAQDISLLLKKNACAARAAKLTQLIQQINNSNDAVGINSEMLLRLLPID